jgi:uncharacterized membrane protein YoaK (UPF0700 family)
MFAKSQGKKRLATGMAFLTGWADVALFFKYKSFATMMTGNTMWMALATIENRYKDAFYYASLIVSYIFGVAAFRKVHGCEDRSIRYCGLAVMALFVFSDIIQHATSTRWIPMVLLATAFGLTNSVGQEVTGTLTFVVTGSMTKLANQFVDRVSRRAGRKKLTAANKHAVVLNCAVIGGFFAGALWAFVLQGRQLLDRFGVFSLLGTMYGALFLWQDTRYLGGGALFSWWARNDANMHTTTVNNDDDDDRTTTGASEIEDDLKQLPVGLDPLDVNNLPL